MRCAELCINKKLLTVNKALSNEYDFKFIGEKYYNVLVLPAAFSN